MVQRQEREDSPMKKSVALLCVCLTALLLSGITQSRAQSTTATLSGVIVDETGAVLPGTQLTVTNTATGLKRSLETDERGWFVVPQLAPGPYEVTATQPGFETLVRRGITLAVSQEANLTLSMKVGAVTQQVEVTGEAPLINTSSSSVSGVVDEQRIQELPLNGRDFSQLPLVQAGVNDVLTGDTAQSKGSGARISMGGSRVDQTAWLLDGTNIGSPSFFGTPGGAAGVMLGVDAVREFQVLTSNYSAEVGGSSGGVVNMVTKSGTNNLHGTAFYSLRNSALDARNYNDTSGKPPFKRNQFGASAGGPIRKDKTFFFGDYEAIIQRRGVSKHPQVPDLDVRRGLIPDSAGAVPTVNGPRRQVTVAPEMQPYLDLWPKPNGPEVNINSGVASFDFAPPNPVDEHYYVIRGDHIITDKQTLFARVTLDQGDITNPDDLPITTTKAETNTRYATVAHDYIASPQLLVSTRLAGNRTLLASDEIALVDYPKSLNILLPGYLFSVGYSGVTGIGVSTQNIIKHAQTLFTVDERFLYVRGRHSMKFGATVNRIESSRTGGSSGLNGSMGWPNVERFLTDGAPKSFTATALGVDTARTYLQYAYGVFFQDDWKVTPNFTMNLGLRYEPFTSPDERHGRESTVRDWVTATKFQTDIGLFRNPSKKNVSPRVGFAWDPKGDGKTAVRAGFGIFFVQLLSRAYVVQGAKNPPFFATTSEIQGNLASVPSDLARISPSLVGATLTPNSFMEITQWDLNPSYEMKANLTVERQLTDTLSVSLGYLGGRGIHLWRNTDANAAPFIEVNGRAFVVAGTPRVNRNASVGQTRYSDAQSFYNAMQIEVKKRFGGGLQFQTSYTWSKNIDDSTTGVANTDYNEGSASQAYQTKVDRGLSALHNGQNLVVSGIYALPSPIDSGFLAHVFDGWQLSSIFRAKSGTPFSVKVSARNAPDLSRGAAQQRPDVAEGRNRENITSGTTAGCGNVSTGQRLGTADLYYDPCAFILPPVAPAGYAAGSGFYGISGRNFLTGSGLVNFDFSLRKSFPIGITEGTQLEFQADTFNLFNRTSLPLPSGSVLNPSLRSSQPYVAGAGRITAPPVTNARQFQFGLKITF